MKQFNGMVYSKQVEDFVISWESFKNYRYWCLLERPLSGLKKKTIAVIMFNPGSLSHDGKSILKDTTLRNLRNLFRDQNFSCLVLNIFDLATPSPQQLYLNWKHRNSKLNLEIFKNLKTFGVTHYFMAYGNLPDEGTSAQQASCLEKITEIKKILASQHISEIEPIVNMNNRPVHPYRYNFKHPNANGQCTGLQLMREVISRL